VTLAEFEAFVKSARALGVEAFELGELKVTFGHAHTGGFAEPPMPDGPDSAALQRHSLRELLNADAPLDEEP
jgi:hypothetical protein